MRSQLTFFFNGARDGTQALVHPRQVLPAELHSSLPSFDPLRQSLNMQSRLVLSSQRSIWLCLLSARIS